MIDIHIVRHPKQARENGLLGLVEKLATCPMVYTQVIPGCDRNIGAGRTIGFSAGNRDFVSFVDDDDDIDLDAIRACIDELKKNPDIDLAVTRERVVYNGQARISPRVRSATGDITPRDINHVHHLVVARRAAVERYLHVLRDAVAFPEFTMWAAMLLDGVRMRQLDIVGYTWFVHPGGARSMKLPATETTRELINRCICWKPSRL